MSIQIKNSATRYGLVAKLLHWSIAFLFLFQFLSILYFRFLEEEATDLTWSVLNLHKSTGLLILLLGVFRLFWRNFSKLPDWPEHFSEWDQSVTHFAEYGLYTSLFLMTVSGLLIELFGGHYIPFFGLFYLDALTPYLHIGAVSYDETVVAARGLSKILTLSNIFVLLHIIGAYGVIVFFTTHIAHVIKHHRQRETQILGRMLPQKEVKSESSKS
ncbi:MAG: cytochrome b/b6 domain-containing protein [Myxococcota bacterium]|nr:cytochrome b/b6 domain-containing protein [Myxococcota bacterium]